MTSYLARLEATPPADRWRLARGWLFAEPAAFFAELRHHRPVLALPEVTLVTRHADCVEVLTRHDLFSVRLYAPKQGTYWMAQDETPQHVREKGIMQAILDREDVPAIRRWVAEEADRRLDRAEGTVDLVAHVTRHVPIALVQEWFGFADSDPSELRRWSYWNQQDAFWNQPFDAVAVPDPARIVAEREAANVAMRGYLKALVRRRAEEAGGGAVLHDPVSRLLRLTAAKALRLDPAAVVLNVGGLLIGAVETTSHAAVNALAHLHGEPGLLEAARDAAGREDADAVDGFVFEALRLDPPFPYFFRTAEADTALARGTDHETAIARGTTVLAITRSAMRDEARHADPEHFDAQRGDKGFLFGLGIHSCLGRAIAGAMVPELVRRVLRRKDLRPGPIDRGLGGVPEAWPWTVGPVTPPRAAA